ncbi:16S rRNA (guanine(527)-N(7))-methyltransferase RsmG [Actinomyces sp. 565]|uniref:16S rRNA (guanine(527)-N(7))-methyltransferase RsmG n=2 Tax=Actinomyces TaxID=1654 RepID=UPI0013A707CE|nr:16S rRNA (guanine(527)-N(7))-methyltransferase RsmG [Actinomyces sp. 565]NDR54136.1 16S rRNA (guanine(527)-N(7))-methyltransferase RsmG [Actinomyces sp. 565]
MSTPAKAEASGSESQSPAGAVEQPTEQMRAMFGPAFYATEHFAQMLAEQGELRGLLGPRELPRLWTRHIINSAAVVPFLPDHGTVADIGTGAGFPGVVVALLRPDLDVVLVESMERRTQWLEDVVAELDLDNVTIRRARAEELRARYAAVTARAVANLTKLIRITSPLLKPGASLLALKGARAEAEVDEAKYVIKRARLEPAVIHEVVTPDGELTKVVQVRRPASR